MAFMNSKHQFRIPFNNCELFVINRNSSIFLKSLKTTGGDKRQSQSVHSLLLPHPRPQQLNVIVAF